jgi:hypothetical protein
VALIARGDPNEGRSHHLKRIVKTGNTYELRSDNPAHPTLPARADDEPIAILEKAISPEQLAPDVGTTLAIDDVPRAFGVEGELVPPYCRVAGHLFLMLEILGQLPDFEVPDRRPGETGFVFTHEISGDRWRYGGAARWSSSDRGWLILEE